MDDLAEQIDALIDYLDEDDTETCDDLQDTAESESESTPMPGHAPPA